MTPQPYSSLIVGPLVLVLGLGGLWFAGWLAFHDPLALAITFAFFAMCYRVVKWLVKE